MGCTQSSIEKEESVMRCRARKLYMKESVRARNAFAAAHSTYAINVKNTGAAISDFAHAELPSHVIHGSQVPLSSIAGSSSSSTPPPLPSTLPHNPLLPPPPPLPDLGSPIQRAVSMPHIKIRKAVKPERVSIVETEEGDDANDEEKLVRRSGGSNRGRDQPPPTLVQRDAIPTPAPQPQDHASAYEFFFPNVENMPGTTLAEPVVVGRAASLKKSELRIPVEAEEEEEDEDDDEDEDEEDDEIEVENDGEDDEDFVIVPETKKEKKPEVPVQVPKVQPMDTNEQPPKQPIKGESLVRLFEDLDDHFLKASQSAYEVTKMLEATRLHYHSNFADNRGHIDHSARVMRVITWNRSFTGLPTVDDEKNKDDSEENETHATVLDKLLAWEKKLYDEVKVGEQMKYDYQKKVDRLNKKKKRGAKPESLEKLKAAVSHLHTRYIVDMQSMDSTVAEINRLRDEQLYPKLSHLVKGMGMMWDSMRMHHEAQTKIAYQLKLVDVSATPVETSEHHHERTLQLAVVAEGWHAEFCKLIDYQRAYIKALNNWLKRNLVPIESNYKEKVSSPPRIPNPPIQELVATWESFLDACQDEGARSAIKNFAAVVHAIYQHQEEEMRWKERCEETKKELDKRTRQFEEWYNKFVQTKGPAELDPESAESEPHRAALGERRAVIEELKKRLQEEEEAHRKMTVQVRDKSFTTLKTRLPELFASLSEIAKTFSDAYLRLASVPNPAPGD